YRIRTTSQQSCNYWLGSPGRQHRIARGQGTPKPGDPVPARRRCPIAEQGKSFGAERFRKPRVGGEFRERGGRRRGSEAEVGVDRSPEERVPGPRLLGCPRWPS